ncbi:permease [Anaerotruncus rubiinfantis]|uniref:permease n=1 Tax=Anaerotruncus rubiinfantis TaxID=1720200 RepID=UPI0034A4E71D
MTRFSKIMLRYRFFTVLLLLNIGLSFIAPEIGKKTLLLSLDNLLEMLSIIPPVFILLGLMDVWIPKEIMMKYMGKGAGIKGGVFAFALGSFSAGPLYAAFPIAAIFLKKGVSLTNVFIFIGAWSAEKIPMMLFEVTQLGGKFAISRFVLNLIGTILLAFVVEKTTSEEEYEKIQQTACNQLEAK